VSRHRAGAFSLINYVILCCERVRVCTSTVCFFAFAMYSERARA
jgi:hypothetical protein